MDSTTSDPLPPEKSENAPRKPWSTPKVLLGTISSDTWSDSAPSTDPAGGTFGTGNS